MVGAKPIIYSKIYSSGPAGHLPALRVCITSTTSRDQQLVCAATAAAATVSLRREIMLERGKSIDYVVV